MREKEGLLLKLIDTLLHDPSAYLEYLKLKGRDTRFTDYEEIVWLFDEAKKDAPYLDDLEWREWFNKWHGEGK